MSSAAGRFLTTHVGSLPRPARLIEIMFAREDGLPLEAAAVEAEIGAAVDAIVARQVVRAELGRASGRPGAQT
jgi:5-methyltetrahydropteroyltriglutamate--homocysteine methyltransferase